MIGEHVVTLIPLDSAPPELVETRRNLLWNPSLETNATGWSAVRGTIAYGPIPHPVAGVNGLIYTPTTLSGGSNHVTHNRLRHDPVTPGEPVTFAVNVEPTMLLDGKRYRLGVYPYDAAGGQITTYWSAYADGVCPGGVSTRLVFTTPPLPAETANVLTLVMPEGSFTDYGQIYYVDGAILEVGATAGDYFDGDAPDAPPVSYDWTGTPHGSGSVEITTTGAGPADITCLVDRVAIRHGRDDADSQPEASSATLELAPPYETDAMPGVLEIGAGILVETRTLAGTYPRFRGIVTDLSYTWEDAGEDTPNRLKGQVIAVGPLADLGRRIVGDAPWPQEIDGTRVAAVMEAAGIPLDPLYSDPGTVQILPRDVDSQPALDVIRRTAESANGMLWETRDGEIRYADADHRRGNAVALELDSCDVLVTPMWKRSTEALLNKVSLGYGPVPDEGEQPRYIAQRDDSIGRYGRYELSTETELAEYDDAAALGNLLLTRNSSPVWIMAELPVDMGGLDPVRTDALLGLDMHALVGLTGLPSAGAAPTTANLWLEGWTETLEYGSHEITLAVTGYCRTVPAPRWNDLHPGTTWDTAPGTWDDAVCMGPPLALGRWDDVPASTRWDLVPASVTWDTWKV